MLIYSTRICGSRDPEEVLKDKKKKSRARRLYSIVICPPTLRLRWAIRVLNGGVANGWYLSLGAVTGC